MKADTLKLYNIGWQCKDKQISTNPFSPGYHQIGELKVFAYSEWEAYDFALIELSGNHKGSLDRIQITIIFVEEIIPTLGVVNYRKTKWSDAREYGDWLNQRSKLNQKVRGNND